MNTSKVVINSVCHGGVQAKDKIFLPGQKYFSQYIKPDDAPGQRYCDLIVKFKYVYRELEKQVVV